MIILSMLTDLEKCFNNFRDIDDANAEVLNRREKFLRWCERCMHRGSNLFRNRIQWVGRKPTIRIRFIKSVK